MSTPSDHSSVPGRQVEHLAIPAYYTQTGGRGSDRWPWVIVALITAVAAVAVVFMITVGSKQRADRAGTVAKAGTHRSPATKVVTKVVNRTLPGASTTVIREEPATSSAAAGPASAAGSCAGRISINAHTSCQFAQNVVDEYNQLAQQAGAPGTFAVHAYSPVTNQSYTDTCSYDSSNATVSCSHGGDLIQFNYGYTPGVVSSSLPGAWNPPSAESTPAPGSCAGRISINAHTSCQFAQNVVDEYNQLAQQAGAPGTFAVHAYSPVTNQSYTDTCSYDSSNATVSCSHGGDLIQFNY